MRPSDAPALSYAGGCARRWIEMRYKALGPGLHALAGRKTGDELSVLGPIGRPSCLIATAAHTAARRWRGDPPMVFLAERLVMRAVPAYKPLVLMGSEVRFRLAPGPRR